jgi:hypothetical protein
MNIQVFHRILQTNELGAALPINAGHPARHGWLQPSARGIRIQIGKMNLSHGTASVCAMGYRWKKNLGKGPWEERQILMPIFNWNQSWVTTFRLLLGHTKGEVPRTKIAIIYIAIKSIK